MPRTWEFVQSEYIQEHDLGKIGALNEGVCISLSCRWAKMILKSKKASFGVPQVTNTDRGTYFAKAKAPGKVAANQNAFDKARGEAQQTLASSKDALVQARSLFQQGEMSWTEYEMLSKSVMAGAKDGALESDHSLQVITAANKLKIEETVACQSFSEYFLNVSTSSCYVFSSSGLEHAFAGYVTSGVFSKDYYFFDPNAGEYLAEGDSKAAVLMAAFGRAYAKSGKVASTGTRLKVSYTG